MNGQATVHSVQFYESDQALIDRLSGIVCSGLEVGNAVVIVATSAHRRQLEDAVKRLGVDVEHHASEGRLMMLDARETLATFMVNNVPDSGKFGKSVGGLLREARERSRAKDKGVTVYGEMVAELWADGNSAAAIALEDIWNRTLSQQYFHLHCAYPRKLVAKDPLGFQAIKRTHSHVFDGLARAV